jgi:hypothetical protein
VLALAVLAGLTTPIAAADGRWSFLDRKIEDPEVLFLWPGQDPKETVDGLDEPIVTDRPDFTEASSVVGRGVFQLEGGYTFFRDGSSGSRSLSHSYPETLYRFGLTRWMEMRVGHSFMDLREGSTTSSGSKDLYLGTKLGITAQSGIRPEMALMPQMTVPTGSAANSDGDVLPGLSWLYGWTINDRFFFGGGTQFNRAKDGGTAETYTQWAQSATLNVGWTERLSSYFEFFSFHPYNADTDLPEYYFNSGMNFLITNNFKWDVRAGKGLNDNADDFFAGTGFAVRFGGQRRK